MMIYPIFSLIYIFFCSIYKISNQFILLGLTIYARTTTQYSIQLSHWRVFFLKSAFRLSGGHASGSFNRNQMDCNHFNTRSDVNADEKKCKIKYFCWFESKCVGQNSKKSSLIFMTKHNLWALSMTKFTAIKSGYFKPIGKLLLWFYSCRLFFFSETSLIKLWSCGYGCQSFYKRTSLFFFSVLSPLICFICKRTIPNPRINSKLSPYKIFCHSPFYCYTNNFSKIIFGLKIRKRKSQLITSLNYSVSTNPWQKIWINFWRLTSNFLLFSHKYESKIKRTKSTALNWIKHNLTFNNKIYINVKFKFVASEDCPIFVSKLNLIINIQRFISFFSKQKLKKTRTKYEWTDFLIEWDDSVHFLQPSLANVSHKQSDLFMIKHFIRKYYIEVPKDFAIGNVTMTMAVKERKLTNPDRQAHQFQLNRNVCEFSWVTSMACGECRKNESSIKVTR